MIGVLSKPAGFDNCGYVIGFDFDQGLSAQAVLRWSDSALNPRHMYKRQLHIGMCPLVFIELTFPEKALESERERREILFFGLLTEMQAKWH